MQYPLISEVGFVALVTYIAGEVGPRDGVGTPDEPGVGDRSEGFANVGGVGDVAMCAEKDGADTGCVGGIANVGVGGFVGTVDRTTSALDPNHERGVEYTRSIV